MVSIIVPVYNEEKILSENSYRFKNISGHTEFILVDGGSSDRSVEIAGRVGKVVPAERGRALQMNSGARLATGDILLFLHADAFIGHDSIKIIEESVKDRSLAGGCLSQRIGKKGVAFRAIEKFGNARAEIGRASGRGRV